VSYGARQRRTSCGHTICLGSRAHVAKQRVIAFKERKVAPIQGGDVTGARRTFVRVVRCAASIGRAIRTLRVVEDAVQPDSRHHKLSTAGAKHTLAVLKSAFEERVNNTDGVFIRQHCSALFVDETSTQVVTRKILPQKGTSVGVEPKTSVRKSGCPALQGSSHRTLPHRSLAGDQEIVSGCGLSTGIPTFQCGHGIRGNRPEIYCTGQRARVPPLSLQANVA